jgi:hypothetical protein
MADINVTVAQEELNFSVSSGQDISVQSVTQEIAVTFVEETIAVTIREPDVIEVISAGSRTTWVGSCARERHMHRSPK